MILDRPKVLPHPHCVRNDVRHVFVPQEKTFFLWKNIFSHFALLYHSARVEPDHENHQFSWKTMIFIDFHWFLTIILDSATLYQKNENFRNRWISKIFEFYTRHHFRTYKHGKTASGIIIDDEKKYISVRIGFSDG